MKSDVDVLVIGGGAIGVCSAYYIAREGLSVCLVEKGELASGCSGANTGLVVPSHSVPLVSPGALRKGLKSMLKPDSPFYIKPRLDPLLFSWLSKFRRAAKPEQMRRGIRILRELNYSSLNLFQNLIENESLACNYQQDGWLMVYKTEKGLRDAEEEARLLKSYDISIKIMNSDETLEMEPTLYPDLSGSIYFPDDAHLDPTKFIKALAERLEKHGVTIQTQAEVLGFETSSERITLVKTTRGDFKPGKIVLAAGAWSRSIMRNLGFRLLVQPAKGYSISFKRPEDCPRTPLYLSEAKVVVSPLEADLRFAGTLELTGMDLSLNKRRVKAIMNAAQDYLGYAETMETKEVRAGLRPCCPDGLPMIDRAPGFKNLMIATGHGMLGITQAPVTGKLVSQLVCEQTPDIDLNHLRVTRFR